MIINLPKRSIQAEKMLWQRKLASKTQAEMARLLNVDLKTYTNWENGRVDLSIDKIKKFAKALNIDYKVIWNEDDFIRRVNYTDLVEVKSKIVTVNENAAKYNSSEFSLQKSNLNDKDALIKALREEVEYLRQVNKALATSLNQLNEKKS